MKLQTCNATYNVTSVGAPRRSAPVRLSRVLLAAAAVVAIIYGELWAIRQAPVLPASSASVATSSTTHSAGINFVCFPIAILH